jgi:hypothetical protein
VIDDGSHLADHAILVLLPLPVHPSGGIDVVEDLQTSYSKKRGGTIPSPDNTAGGLARDLVDAVQVHDPTFAAGVKTAQRRRTGLPMSPHSTCIPAWMCRWKPALNAFAVTFEGRLF